MTASICVPILCAVTVRWRDLPGISRWLVSVVLVGEHFSLGHIFETLFFHRKLVNVLTPPCLFAAAYYLRCFSPPLLYQHLLLTRRNFGDRNILPFTANGTVPSPYYSDAHSTFRLVVFGLFYFWFVRGAWRVPSPDGSCCLLLPYLTISWTAA